MPISQDNFNEGKARNTPPQTLIILGGVLILDVAVCIWAAVSHHTDLLVRGGIVVVLTGGLLINTLMKKKNLKS